MDKEITLALLTPRSGALNYRYLIPEGVSYNDMQLGEIRNQLERSEKDRPGALFQCEARQLGGRMGTEVLIFHVPDFQRYPQEEQKRCRELLKDWFDNKRDAVIQAIDWSSRPNTQTIAIPELTQLKNQLYAILTRPQISESQSCSSAKISFIFKNLLLIMIALTVSILLISGIQFGDVFQKIRQLWNGESNVQEQEQELLGKLAPYKGLFQFPTNPTESSVYKEAFDDLYRYCDLPLLNPVDKYLQENYVKNLRENKSSFAYKVFGQVPEAKTLNNAKGISPVQLRRILAAYQKLQKTVFNESQNSVFTSMFNNEKFKIDALMKEHTDILLNDSKKKAQPKFFVQAGSVKELEWAMTVRGFIISIIKENQSDNVVTRLNLSQMNLSELIGSYTLFENAKCESDEMQGAFKEFCNVLKEIAEQSRK